MSAGTCSVDGCERQSVNIRGWCGTHYHRWRKHGSPTGGRNRYATPEESFAARTAWNGDCLEWTTYKTPKGYGKLRVGNTMKSVHRYAFEKANGPIPDGMWIDHTCHNRACVNVEHLRLADPTENARNRAGATVQSSTGVRNVYPRSNGTFRVSFGVNKKLVGFGTYPTLEEAASVAEEKRKELFGEFSGGGR